MSSQTNISSALENAINQIMGNASASAKEAVYDEIKDLVKSEKALKIKIGSGDSLFLDSYRNFHEHLTILSSNPPLPTGQMSPAEDAYAAGMIALVIGQNNLTSNESMQEKLATIQNNQMIAGDAKIHKSAAQAQSSQEKSGVMKVVSWVTSGVETLVGAALCCTGVGAAVGADLLASGVIGIAANIISGPATKALAGLLEDCGVPKKIAGVIAAVVVGIATIAAALGAPSCLGSALGGRIVSQAAETTAESAGEILDTATTSVKNLDQTASDANDALNALRNLSAEGGVADDEVTVCENSLEDLNTAVATAKQSATRLQEAVGELKTAISEGASAKTIATKSEQVLELSRAYQNSTQDVVKAAYSAEAQIFNSSAEISTSIGSSIWNATKSADEALTEAKNTTKLAETFQEAAFAEANPTTLSGKVRTWVRSQLPEDTAAAKRTLVSVSRARWITQGVLGAGQIDASVGSAEAGFDEADVLEFQGRFNEETTLVQQNIQAAKTFLQDIQTTMSQAGQSISNSRTQGFQA